MSNIADDSFQQKFTYKGNFFNEQNVKQKGLQKAPFGFVNFCLMRTQSVSAVTDFLTQIASLEFFDSVDSSQMS